MSDYDAQEQRDGKQMEANVDREETVVQTQENGRRYIESNEQIMM
jgi:hypothetical protein